MIQNLIIKNRLQSGDVIVAKKKSGIGRILNHYIVYLGNGEFIGNLSKGVKIIPSTELMKLLQTYEPVKIRKFLGSEYERYKAKNRAYTKLGHKYSLVNFNCEHFANWVQFGKEKSSQVTLASTALLLGITYKLIKTIR
ncbi:hypothetical protein KUL118_66710 [Tenacibaculum sp. KUL118]|nr:hypothetical protein KUL118_66710 [Tenacibaculum sp. KUL118]